MKHKIKFNEEKEIMEFESKDNVHIVKEIKSISEILDKIEVIARQAQDSSVRLMGYKKDKNQLSEKRFLWYSGKDFNICLEDRGIDSIDTYLAIEFGEAEYSRPIREIIKITDKYIEFSDERIEYIFNY